MGEGEPDAQNIKVAVRCRPLNQRETSEGGGNLCCKVCPRLLAILKLLEQYLSCLSCFFHSAPQCDNGVVTMNNPEKADEVHT